MAKDWISTAAVIVSIAGAVVPVVLWQVDRETKSLSVRQVTTVSLQPEAVGAIPSVTVSIDGTQVPKPFVSTIEISNDGSRPISVADFEGPLLLKVRPGVSVVRTRVSSTTPADLPLRISAEPSLVSVAPLLLNPGDMAIISILTSGGQPGFRPSARIAGISEIAFEIETDEERQVWKAFVYLPVAVAGIALYALYLYPAPFRRWTPGPLGRALSGLVALFGGALAIQEGARAIGTSMIGVAVTVFVAGALVAYVIGRRIPRHPLGGTDLS